MPRRYEQRRRAERQEETRQRIVDATVQLHQEVGMLRTTIKEIARRSGVERATVYRHFPDERALIQACTGHYFAQNPPPDPAPWRDEVDPVARLRTGLAEVYAWHRQTEPMFTRNMPEIDDVPAAKEVVTPLLQHMETLRDVLATGWNVEGPAHEVQRALIGHALEFWTWKSLVRQQGLDDDVAVDAMVTLVSSFAAGSAAAQPAALAAYER